MPEFSLPTASKQNSIASTIGNPNPTVADETSIMNYLKKIDNTQLQQGRLKPIISAGEITTATNTTVLNINGSGFLRKSALTQIGTSTATWSMRIYIDGTLMFTFNGSAGGGLGHAIGIFQRATAVTSTNDVKNASITVGSYGNSIQGAIPYTNGVPIVTAYSIILEGEKIPFNQSLKVEVSSSTNIVRAYEVIAEVY